MKIMPVNALIGLSFIGFLFASSAQADSVTLNLSARIQAAPCTVNPVLVAGQPVSLGSLDRGGFQNSGDADPTWHAFSLDLTNCSAATQKVTATFSGTADSNDAALFANSATVAPATNMAVEVSKQNDNGVIISNGSTLTVNVDTPTGTASFPLAARMKTPIGNVQGGKVSAVMVVDFTYQ